MRPNILRTLWFNIRAFGFRTAFKLPVYVYGRVKVYNMGRIELLCPIERGLVKIGRNYDDTSLPYTIWNNMGKLQIHGKVWIHHGCRLLNRGTIVFQGNDIISHACVFDIRERLEFGCNVSVGYCSEFTDTDVHYLLDVNTHTVVSNTKPIRVGSFNWFGSHTYVKKGTVTPDGVIVASPNAVLLRDYTSDIASFSVLGGSPARLIAQGKRRIFNFRNEVMVRDTLTEQGIYTLPVDANEDEFCGLE